MDLRRGLRWTITAALALLVAATSRLPWTPASEPVAHLRLSWRYAAPTVEACRPPTEEELSGLPQHMRPTEVCDGGPIPFHLRVAVDGEVIVDESASDSDERAISVYHEHPVTPGDHEVVVEFWPDSSTTSLPPDLARELHADVSFPAGRAKLVTLGPSGLLVLDRTP